MNAYNRNVTWEKLWALRLLLMFPLATWAHDPLICRVAFRPFANRAEASSAKGQRIIVEPNPVPGPYGGELYLVKKLIPSLHWTSPHKEHQAAPQGSVEWMGEVFGQDLAAILGYIQISDTEYRIPNAAAINAGIRRLNEVLLAQGHETIRLSYFSSPHDRERAEKYLENFESARLPIAEGSPSMVHDVSYHIGAIALPERLMAHAIRHTKFLRQFVNQNRAYIRQKDAHTMAMIRLAEVDAGTANSFYSIVGWMDADQLHASLGELTHKGNSSKKYLEKVRDRFKFNWLLKWRFNRFIAQQAKDPEFNHELSAAEFDQLCTEYAAKAQNIRAAAAKIRRPFPAVKLDISPYPAKN